MDAGFVDGINSRIGVRVGGEQCALGERVHLRGLGEEVHAIHLGHALVRQEQSDGIVARLQLAEGGQAGAAGICAHDAVAVRIAASQVALNGPEHLGVVIYGQ